MGGTIAQLPIGRQVGDYISRRISSDGWGRNTVVALAKFIRRQEPAAGGFSAQNLWRMRQFFETWRGFQKLSALLRELPWTHNLIRKAASLSTPDKALMIVPNNMDELPDAA